MTVIARAVRYPWRVVRTATLAACHTTTVVCSHRGRRRAEACSLLRDAVELVGTGFVPVARHDVRHRTVPRMHPGTLP